MIILPSVRLLQWLGAAFFVLSCTPLLLTDLSWRWQLLSILCVALALMYFLRQLQWQQQWHSLQLKREGRVVLYHHGAEHWPTTIHWVRLYLGGLLIVQLAEGRRLYFFLPGLDQDSRWQLRRLYYKH